MEASDRNHPKNQHYVPQFLLRNFSFDNGEHVFCFDKKLHRRFPASVRDVASEKWFYDFKEGVPDSSLEPAMTDLEATASLTINRKLLTDRTIRALSQQDRLDLSLFMAVQMLRTRGFREQMRDIDAQMQAQFGDSPVGQALAWDEPTTRQFAIAMIRIAGDLVPPLMDKVWILYESKDEFILSDNPVGLQNTVNRSTVYGTLGLAVKGIEIYLPLSSRYTLGLICRDTFNEFVSFFDSNYRQLDSMGRFEARNFVNSARRKLPFKCIPDNVINMNSIQVVTAERFLFGARDDFSLAEEMVNSNPQLRAGRRATVN